MLLSGIRTVFYIAFFHCQLRWCTIIILMDSAYLEISNWWSGGHCCHRMSWIISSNYSGSPIACLYSQGLRIKSQSNSTYLSSHIQISNKTSHDGICNFGPGIFKMSHFLKLSGWKVKLPSCSLLEALHCTGINTWIHTVKHFNSLQQ